jgi:tyrosinase
VSTPPDPIAPRIPELAGATSSPFTLAGAPITIDLPIQEPTGPASLTDEELEGWAPRRVFLNVERMIGEMGSPPYGVYLNVPPGETPLQHPELLAGNLAMFGLRESSISDEKHTPNGLYTQLEVTNLYAGLPLLANWNPKMLHVTFVPKYPGNLPPVRVGRLSLYFA